MMMMMMIMATTVSFMMRMGKKDDVGCNVKKNKTQHKFTGVVAVVTGDGGKLQLRRERDERNWRVVGRPHEKNSPPRGKSRRVSRTIQKQPLRTASQHPAVLHPLLPFVPLLRVSVHDLVLAFASSCRSDNHSQRATAGGGHRCSVQMSKFEVVSHAHRWKKPTHVANDHHHSCIVLQDTTDTVEIQRNCTCSSVSRERERERERDVVGSHTTHHTHTLALSP